MDKKTEETMARNLEKKTGRSLKEWITVARKLGSMRHNETVEALINEHKLGRFFADLIVHKANGSDALSRSPAELVGVQYKGKEHLFPIYQQLTAYAATLAPDLEIAPKKGYVSLRRKKQFACLKPATKTRFELDLILKGQKASGVLKAIPTKGAMCTHRISLESPADITAEVKSWLKAACEKGG